MKSSIVLLTLFLSLGTGIYLHADIPEKAEVAVKRDVLTHLGPGVHPARMFSRVALVPPTVDWREQVNSNLISFKVTHGTGGILLGLYNSKTDEVLLLDPATLTYVDASTHPVMKERLVILNGQVIVPEPSDPSPAVSTPSTR